jgi:hypothetical protein
MLVALMFENTRRTVFFLEISNTTVLRPAPLVSTPSIPTAS